MCTVIIQDLNNYDLMKWKVSCPISLTSTTILSTCIIIKFRLAVYCTLLRVCLCLEYYIMEREELELAISVYTRIILYFSAHDSTDLPGRKMFKYITSREKTPYTRYYIIHVHIITYVCVMMCGRLSVLLERFERKFSYNPLVDKMKITAGSYF